MKNMNKLLVCLLSALSATSFGQSVQPGFVKEYNERMQKTPLSDVEIVISNASSTASGVRGDFMLQFRTLKPGDKVNVRRIEKLGYEIFNKEALEQWFISRDNSPFTIVMCKSDRFKRIRDTYSRVSSESYEKQLKKEEARLEAERKAGKLKEAEYEAALKKLNDEYDQQLDNLDNYVDRFARIDLSELSAVEAEIIELVQNGKIEAAIQRYDDQHLEEKYKEQVAVAQKAQAGIDALTTVRNQSQMSRDSLFASILRKNEMLKLAGGRENFEKIGKSLKETALADTTYLDAVWVYGLFCLDNNIYEDAEVFLKKCLAITTNSMKLSDIYNRLGGIYERTNRRDEAENYFMTALTYLDSLENKKEIATINNNLGVLFCHIRQHQQAKIYLEKAISLREELLDTNNMESVYELACSYNNLGMTFAEMLQFEESEKAYLKTLPLDSITEKNGNTIQKNHIGTTYNNLATTYHRLSSYQKAEIYYLKSIEKRLEYVNYNPEKYLPDLISTESNMAILYMEQGKLSEAKAMAEDAILKINPLFNKYPNAYRTLAINCFNTIANIYNLLKEYQKAASYYKNAIDNANMLPPSKYAIYVKGVLLGNYGAVQVYCTNYGQAEKAYKESLEMLEQMQSEANLPNIAMQQFNLGALYRLFLHDNNSAEHYLRLSIDNYQSLNNSHPNAYDKLLAQSLSSLSMLYSREGKVEAATKLYKQAFSILPELQDVLDAQGVLEYTMGNEEKARKTWERKKQLDPEEARVNSWLYELLFNSQKKK